MTQLQINTDEITNNLAYRNISLSFIQVLGPDNDLITKSTRSDFKNQRVAAVPYPLKRE